MLYFSSIIAASTVAYGIFSVLSSLLLPAGCALLTVSLFRLMPNKSRVIYIIAAAVAVFNGIYQTLVYANPSVLLFNNTDSLVELLCPYICLVLLFPLKKIWKPFLVSIGTTLLEAVKYIIMMSFYSLDMKNINLSLDLAFDFVINLAFFATVLGFFLRYARKNNSELPITKINVPLYILIVTTLTVFVVTMLLFGMNYSSKNRRFFLLSLSNIPLFTFTVVYATRIMLKSKIAEENYRQMAEMQVRHYEQMEKKNEELKVFRHDFPKKLRPLKLYLKEGRYDEAEKILDEFSVTVDSSRPRFSTGNFRLDTVLECQQQLCDGENIKIIFPFDSVFPPHGIAAEDIYTIFPNVLDNAIEACRAVGGGEIVFSSRMQGNMVFISVTNPFNGKLNKNDGSFETTKNDKENHGYGLKSIKKAAAKYGSDNVSFTVENNVFTLNMVLLKLAEDSV
ncbi:MAG: GHKL domain-containing protein [Clostridia bacterium]|nr:GHKL domain-containing protein [Clostridia bacterium]